MTDPVKVARHAPVPTKTGWYWVRDEELMEGTWCLGFLNVRGDRHSDGQPLLELFDNDRANPGPANSWKFFWDGEEWICPDDVSAATPPLEFVPAESPLKTRHQIDMAADRMYDAIRTFLAAPNNEASMVAERGLSLVADNYDAAISSGDLETDDATAP